MKIDIYYNKIKKTTEFITCEDIVFPYGKGWILIRSGYRSDGCSIPKFLWSILSPQIDGRTIIQSIKHDYLFERKLGMFKANWYFFNDLKGSLSLFKRIIILFGLTLFSWTHYCYK